MLRFCLDSLGFGAMGGLCSGDSSRSWEEESRVGCRISVGERLAEVRFSVKLVDCRYFSGGSGDVLGLGKVELDRD